uniref:Tuber-specific elicitor-inducible-like protein n=1 Tax=Zantedeschia hybrid cultivar TaxID=278654 RepID=Q6J4N9_9ARAE|nr:tuber-specific elicitor-inducible-like protein [Zantedeschia hybrid cultivar]
MALKAVLISPFFFLFLAGIITLPAASKQLGEGECLYTIYVQTGDIADAATDAVVSLVISDHPGAGGYDYFERGNLDFFSGQASCLSAPPCWMLLAHDNTGNKPGWFVDHVLVTMAPLANAPVGQHLFRVNQWLARDESPNQLATTRNDCDNDSNIRMSSALQAAMGARNAGVSRRMGGSEPKPM